MPKPDHRPITTNTWAADVRSGRQWIATKEIHCSCGEDCEQVTAWRREAARQALAHDLKLLFGRLAAA